MMLAALFFSAAGQSLARVNAAPPKKVEEPLSQEKSVNPAPPRAVDALDVVISEFRFVGPEGANDEFIELFNPSNIPIPINGWQIWGSNNAGTTGTTPRATLGNVTLQPGQHYLLVNSGASPDLFALADATYSTGITEDGGIALTISDKNNVVDAVGLSAGSYYGEGTPLAPLSGTADQSYERKTSADSVANCNDTDNNAADFRWNQNTSNPQNQSSPPAACITVTNVTSDTANGIYHAGQSIDIQVVFSAPVNVDVTGGTPTLLLETGVVDEKAVYKSSDGNKTLTFTYTVVDGDSSYDLDYVSANALSLNGGSISGAVGEATLILPKPGDPNSLSANKNIVIDDGSDPTTLSFKRQTPSVANTNATSLTFRVSFSKSVTGVDTSDFMVHSNAPAATTTATVTAVTPNSSTFSDTFDVTISGGDLGLKTFSGNVGLDFSGSMNIVDVAGRSVPITSPPIDEVYNVSYATLSVAITQASGQADPAITTPVKFTAVFSDAINVATFTASDITQKGAAPYITWGIADTGDHKTFTLSAYPMGNGTIIPAIPVNSVTDIAGNGNALFDPAIPADLNACVTAPSCVALNDTTAPTVTVKKAITQTDPAYTLPIKFDVVFSEPINGSVFTASDISQNGTATGITWSISDSGDHKNFTLNATVSGYGSLWPFIAANRVTDMVGNNNTPSPITDDGKVEYKVAPTFTPTLTFTPTQTFTPTVTSTQTPKKTVVITEVAWMGTLASSSDEWIELYNPSTTEVNMMGWEIRTFKYVNSTPHIIPFNATTCQSGCVIGPGEFFLMEYREEAVKDIAADFIYKWTALDNGGEMMLLCDPHSLSADLCKPTTPDLASKVIDVVNNWEHDTGTPTPSATTTNPWPAGYGSPYYYSMERHNLAGNNDTNWFTHPAVSPRWGLDANGNYINGTPKHPNWAYDVTSTPRPTASPTRTRTPLAKPAPVLVINEFLARPGHDWNNDGVVDVYDEFIEVANAGSVDVNLSLYKLDDYEFYYEYIQGTPVKIEIRNGYTMPSKVLKPGEIAVFFGSQTGIRLEDNGDTVRLLKSNYSVADAHTYPPVKSLDVSTCRLTDGYGDWVPRCFPTPGQKNSLIGQFFPPEPAGSAKSCTVPDTAPLEFSQAECEDSGLNVWNPSYWNSFPGEGSELWLPDWLSKWLVIFQ